MSTGDARPGAPLGWPLLTATAVTALVPRAWNLGTFSLWLDEIIQSIQAEMPWRQMLLALRSDVHPPLDASLSWVLLHLGAGETGRRLVAVAFGVLTVVLLAELCSRCYGRVAGALTGVVAALSPIHVQYSQELRPYPLALALVVLSLLALERWLADGGSRWLGVSWGALALAGCTLYLASLALVPGVVRYLQASRGSASPRRRLGTTALLASALAPATLWLAYAWPFGNVSLAADPARWSLLAAAARLERLVVGGLEGRGATTAALLVAALVATGFWRSLRHHGDASLVAGAVVGTAGVDLLLLAAGHWSHSRFNLVAWPFLVALVGLALSTLWQARARALVRPLTLVLLLLLALAQLDGLRWYQQRGRPSWDWMARSAAQLAGSDGVVMAGNEWAHLCLSYYLRRNGDHRLADRLTIVPSVADTVALADRECIYVVEGGHGQRRTRWREHATIQQDPGGQGAALFRITPYESGLDCVWTVPYSTRARPRARPRQWEHGQVTVPIDEFARPHLLAGWSEPERSPDDSPFAWATGTESTLALGGGEPRGRRVSFHLLASAPEQSLRVRHNGELVGAFALREMPTTVTAPLGGEWRADNVITLEAASTLVPAARDPRSADDRELSVALSAFTVEYER